MRMTNKEWHAAEREAQLHHATCTVREAIERGGAAEIVEELGPNARKQIEAALTGCQGEQE